MRKLHRRKAFKIARLLLTPGGDGIECRIADLHSQGAKLTFAKSVPETGHDVEIMILPELVPVRAIKVWETDQEMGLQFKKALSYLQPHDTAAA